METTQETIQQTKKELPLPKALRSVLDGIQQKVQEQRLRTERIRDRREAITSEFVDQTLTPFYPLLVRVEEDRGPEAAINFGATLTSVVAGLARIRARASEEYQQHLTQERGMIGEKFAAKISALNERLAKRALTAIRRKGEKTLASGQRLESRELLSLQILASRHQEEIVSAASEATSEDIDKIGKTFSSAFETTDIEMENQVKSAENYANLLQSELIRSLNIHLLGLTGEDLLKENFNEKQNHAYETLQLLMDGLLSTDIAIPQIRQRLSRYFAQNYIASLNIEYNHLLAAQHKLNERRRYYSRIQVLADAITTIGENINSQITKIVLSATEGEIPEETRSLIEAFMKIDLGKIQERVLNFASSLGGSILNDQAPITTVTTPTTSGGRPSPAAGITETGVNPIILARSGWPELFTGALNKGKLYFSGESRKIPILSYWLENAAKLWNNTMTRLKWITFGETAVNVAFGIATGSLFWGIHKLINFELYQGEKPDIRLYILGGILSKLILTSNSIANLDFFAPSPIKHPTLAAIKDAVGKTVTASKKAATFESAAGHQERYGTDSEFTEMFIILTPQEWTDIQPTLQPNVLMNVRGRPPITVPLKYRTIQSTNPNLNNNIVLAVGKNWGELNRRTGLWNGRYQNTAIWGEFLPYTGFDMESAFTDITSSSDPKSQGILKPPLLGEGAPDIAADKRIRFVGTSGITYSKEILIRSFQTSVALADQMEQYPDMLQRRIGIQMQSEGTLLYRWWLLYAGFASLGLSIGSALLEKPLPGVLRFAPIVSILAPTLFTLFGARESAVSKLPQRTYPVIAGGSWGKGTYTGISPLERKNPDKESSVGIPLQLYITHQFTEILDLNNLLAGFLAHAVSLGLENDSWLKTIFKSVALYNSNIVLLGNLALQGLHYLIGPQSGSIDALQPSPTPLPTLDPNLPGLVDAIKNTGGKTLTENHPSLINWLNDFLAGHGFPGNPATVGDTLLGITEGGKHTLYLYDTETGKTITVPLSQGEYLRSGLQSLFINK